MHHFGGDEVAYMWDTEDDNKLFNKFLNWLKTLEPKKSVILWDDPLTDPEKDIQLDKDWIIQTWHEDTTQKMLDKGHRVIVSEANAFYIGNADYDTVSSFKFPEDPNVMGFELAWFTSQDDDPKDLDESWVIEPLKAASKIRRSSSDSDSQDAPGAGKWAASPAAWHILLCTVLAVALGL